MQFYSKIVSFAGFLAVLARTTSAGCTEVGSGTGVLNLNCKSYSAPTNIGQTVSSDSNALSIEFTAQDTSIFQYQYTNNMNYDINFGIQYYNPGPNSDAWETVIVTGGSACIFNLPGHMENFKLTC